MQTTITEVQPAEFELEITATPDDLAPKIEEALRAQRTRASMKGFRPGKVPMSLVKKMYGRALAFEIAEKSIQETYEKEVVASEAYDVLGQPRLTKLDFEDVDSEMHAVIRFGVRPEFELKEISGERVSRLVYSVQDEDVDREVERLRERRGDVVQQEGVAGEKDVVVADLQRLDDSTGAPVIGDKEEGVRFLLDDPRLKDELRQSLLGKSAGDVVRVELPHEGHDHDHEHEHRSELLHLPGRERKPAGHTHRYEVTIRELMRRDVPELTPDFIREATGGEAEDEAGLRETVRRNLERAWQQRSDELLHDQMVSRILERHDLPVPESIVEVYLESFVEDLKQRNDGKLPPDFDEQTFRHGTEPEARRQAKWALIRDRIIEEAGIEVTENDLTMYFERSAVDSGMNAEQLQRLYRQIPNALEQIERRLLSDKLFEYLETRFTIEEKDPEAFGREARTRAELAP